MAKLTLVATGTTGTIGRFLPESVAPIGIDLRSSKEIFEQLEFPRSAPLIHLAGLVGAKKCSRNETESFEINVEGTKKLASSFRKRSDASFIFVSTGHVYRSSSKLVTEEDEIEPVSVYARHKFFAEEECRNVFIDEPERLIILRVFSVLDWNTSEDSLGSTVTKSVSSGKKIEILNSDDIRDFMTPRKVAQITCQIACMVGVSGTFNVCSGQGITVASAVKRMLSEARLYQYPLELSPGNSDFPVLVGDNTKLSAILPGFSLDWNPSPHRI